MTLKSPKLWVGLLSAIGVLALSLRSVERTSPGAITAVHRIEAGLAGERDCAQCHGGLVSSMASACLDCHEPVSAQIDAEEGLHGVIGGGRARACTNCHSEHHGTGFAIVNARSFALAGSQGPEGFDHSLVGFEMDGRHLELECAECHQNADVDVLPAGERRFMGLDRDCASCHDDPHRGRMVLDCAQCHGQTAFDEPGSLGHERHLPLEGAHGELDCTACHPVRGPRSIDAMGLRGLTRRARACTDCHESPHRARFVHEVASLAEVRDSAACGTCHEADHDTWSDERLEMSPRAHAASGFRLSPPHDEIECAACHDPGEPDFERRHPGRRADDCAACHDDPHGGQFDEGPFAEPGCVACHGRERFVPHGFDRKLHQRASMPIVASHAALACEACHEVPGEGEPRTFRGTPARCEDCHEDAHAGFFDERHAERLAARPDGSCAACHRPTAFADVPEGRFDHGNWTGLAVEGAHAQVDCAECHGRDADPPPGGRSLGRVEDVHGAFEGCVSCHVDPHEGRFDGPDLPARVGGRTGCARCHEQSSFRSFPKGFDHGRWTGFPLEGEHARAGCTACHATLDEPTEAGRTWGEALGTRCADCHADPHAGQFSDASDCERCHGSATAFDVLAFDHDRDARFPLGEAHRSVACAECHDAWPLPDGGEVVRYRPLERECTDCHGIHHEQRPRGRKR